MRKLKILSILTVVVLLLSGCQLSESWLFAQLYEDTYASETYITEFDDAWQYGLLNTEMQGYYGSLYTAVMETHQTDSIVSYVDSEETVSIDGVRVSFPRAEMTEDDIVHLFSSFFRDNPHFFYLDRNYRIEGHKSINGDTVYDTLILQYLLPAEERVTNQKIFEQAIDRFLENLPTNADQYDMELYLHDALNEHCTYDSEALEQSADGDPMAYTAYGALVDGSAVCEGYAKGMQILLNEVGIASTAISGEAVHSDESHMWNLVTINGENYFLDPTWNDNQNLGFHTYFNITTDALARTHITGKEIVVPECTATADNYFIKNSTYIDTYEREKIAEIIAQQIRNGDTFVELQFSPKTFDNGLLFLKNGKLTFQKVDSYLVPYDLKLWDYILRYEKETYTITISKA